MAGRHYSCRMQTKILIIGSVWPEPRSSAASLRLMQLIRLFLEQGWSITFATAATESEHMADLQALGVSCRKVEVNSASFDDFAVETAPDIVLFDRFMVEEQFGWRVEKCCPKALRILDTIDLHCLRDARHRALKQGRSMLRDDLFSDMARREIASIYRSDIALIVSDFEEELLKEVFGVPSELLHYCPLMFDTSDITTDPVPVFEERQHFVTIGNFRHAPNMDSILWLKEAIWPNIRARLPDAELHIYGAYAPKSATALHDPKRGFLIHGRAENALAVVKQARVCLAPLRYGAGIKGKLTDAMRTGTPSVTTTIGAEGMHGNQDWCGFIEDDPDAFAEVSVKLCSDRMLWNEKQKQCANILSQRFDRQTHGPALISRIDDLRRALQKQRLDNFTGSMLRFHHHRSTEFMSRWIEAKNENY